MSFLILCSCATSKWKNALMSSGTLDDAVNNAVTDFMHTSKFVDADSTFVVVAYTGGGPILVGISPAYRIYPPERADSGLVTCDKKVINKYASTVGKNFYWWDTTQLITPELIDVFRRFGDIDFSWREDYFIVPPGVNKGETFEVYLFCRDNFRDYKKTKARKANREIMKFKCNSRVY